MYQYLNTRLDWFVKIAIVKLPIRLKGNSKRISGNSLNPLHPVQGFQHCFADVTHRGLISSTKEASLLAVCQILRCLLLYSFLQAIRTVRSFIIKMVGALRFLSIVQRKGTWVKILATPGECSCAKYASVSVCIT